MPTLALFNNVLDLNKLNTSPMKMPIGVQISSSKKQHTPTSSIRRCDTSAIKRPHRISIDNHNHQKVSFFQQQQQQKKVSIAPQRQPSTSSSSTPTASSSIKRFPFLRSSQLQYTSSIMTRQVSEEGSFATACQGEQNKTEETTPWDFIKNRNPRSKLHQPKRLLRKCSGMFSPSISSISTKKQDPGCFRSLPLSDPTHKKKNMMYDRTQWPSVLVQDAVEQDRLVAQHYLLRSAFGNDYIAPVHSLLTNNNKESVMVLDVGCGLGQWSMEMATMYPNASFIGLDLLPTFPRDIKPRNCHFLQLDVRRHPLPFADQSIDYIYQRDLNWGLGRGDWGSLIMEYFRILKPGGWIELVEADLETKSSLEKGCVLNDKLLQGLEWRHQDPYAAKHLPSMLATRGFRRVESQFQSLPLGQDNTDHTHHSHTGQAMASQYLFYLRSLCPWLRRVMGLSQEKYMDHVDHLPCEWNQAQSYVNWHCATAQKPYE